MVSTVSSERIICSPIVLPDQTRADLISMAFIQEREDGVFIELLALISTVFLCLSSCRSYLCQQHLQ